MKIFRNRTFLGIICILIGIATCFIVAPSINKLTNNQVQIIRVTKTIPEGTQIKKDMIQPVKVGGFNLPENILKSENDVIGKFTTAKLEPGDNILSSKVSDRNQSAYLSDLDGNRQAISISIKSFSAGLSGKLQSGDIISLIVSNYEESKQAIAPPELRYIKLLAATTSKGADTDQTKSSDKTDDKNNDNNIPATLTLLVTPEQATKLVDYESNGKLYATLVYRGSPESANKYLSIQDEFLKQIGEKQSVSGQANTASTGGATLNGQ